MLQIKLRSKGGPSTEGAGGAKPSAGEAVTVACPDHLTIADLPVAKSLGSVSAASVVKTVGRKSRRHQGERVHFCVQCDNPIAVYGHLSPCDHAFCLDCARSDSKCYLCGERIQKIQTLKIFEGVFICAAPQCLKSFLKKEEFESHIRNNHGDLLSPNTMKEEGNESEAASAKKPATSDSTVQAPPRSVLSPGASSQLHDREDRFCYEQPRDQGPKLEPQFSGQTPGLLADAFDNSIPPGFDMQGGRQEESGQFQDLQQGKLNENSIPDYAMQFHQPPNITMPNPNLVQNPPQFSYPHFPHDGVPFHGSFQSRQDSAPDGEQRPGSVIGFPPCPAVGPVNFASNYPQPWNVGPTGVPFDPSLVGWGNVDGFKNLSVSDTQGRVAAFQGNFEQRQPANLTPHPTPNQDVEQLRGQTAMEPRDAMSMVAPQLLPPPPSHQPSSQLNHGVFLSGGASHDAQAPGWQPEQRNNFGGA